MSRTTRRAVWALALFAAVLLTACNPLVGQPTRVRPGGVTRSGWITYSGPAGGWLEVSVRSSADQAVSVSVSGRDVTRPENWLDNDWCYFTTDPMPAWSDGSSLGYQRLEHIGPGAELVLSFTAPTDGTTFDLRVVDDAGNAVGDIVHQVPGEMERVGGAICQ